MFVYVENNPAGTGQIKEFAGQEIHKLKTSMTRPWDSGY